jgi:hypothetical protein
MTRQLTTVLFEAIIIGIMNALLFLVLKQLSVNTNPMLLLVVCGALIHLIFEYMGANEWWCKQTYK